MRQHWPAIRTHRPDHHGYEIGHAASIGLVAVLIVLPLIGLAVSWLLGGDPDEALGQLTVYSIAQMLAFSPMVSWMGLFLGVPAVHLAIRWGYGGWLVTMAIGAIAGMVVLLISVWMMMEITSLRISLIGAVFGAVFAGVYWVSMRLTTPALFRRPDSPLDITAR